MDMKWKFFHSFLVTIAMLLLAGSSSIAQEQSITDQLELTARQQELIKELRAQFQRDSKPIVDRTNELLAEEKRLRKARAPESELRRVMKLRADKEIELALAISRFQENIQATLTPEQKKVLQRISDQRNKR
jgi:Spy/CpxP family protein refolding chaperone